MLTDQVNPQILDAVAETNFKVMGEGPAEAANLSNQMLAHAVGLAMENATQTQGGMQQAANSATMACIAEIIKAAAKSL